MYVDVVYVPWINTSRELKTKPAQNALKDLRGFGIIPDMVCVRTEEPAPREVCEKIALFSGISPDAVVNLPDVASVYDVPLNVAKSGVMSILDGFVGGVEPPDMSAWEALSRKRAKEYVKTVRVGLVAKYVGNDDAYICVMEALKAAAFDRAVNLELVWINAEKCSEADFAGVDGVVVPGGFGARGVEGKIAAAAYCLEHDKPYLGLCLGMQAAVIAAARRAGLIQANSTEFDPKTPADVVYLMSGQAGKESTGGTMRLGDYPARLVKGSVVAGLYGVLNVVERHRHRYEVNQKFLPEIGEGGLMVTGRSPGGELVEFVEGVGSKFFVATQSHPEFRSRPMRAHPLFVGFIKALK